MPVIGQFWAVDRCRFRGSGTDFADSALRHTYMNSALRTHIIRPNPLPALHRETTARAPHETFPTMNRDVPSISEDSGRSQYASRRGPSVTDCRCSTERTTRIGCRSGVKSGAVLDQDPSVRKVGRVVDAVDGDKFAVGEIQN